MGLGPCIHRRSGQRRDFFGQSEIEDRGILPIEGLGADRGSGGRWYQCQKLKRPGVQKVLRLARKKKIRAVVVYKLDRIFRSTADALETTNMFERYGIPFHFIEEILTF
jgi:DNA invertase Pin-like site-specific DNA recombinase